MSSITHRNSDWMAFGDRQALHGERLTLHIGEKAGATTNALRRLTGEAGVQIYACADSHARALQVA